MNEVAWPGRPAGDPGKIASLTSLRFFAAALIVLGHSRGSFGIPANWAVWLDTSLGVSFFFTLSGFILTYVYRRMRTRDQIWRYVVARFARIWPAHLATFLLVFLVTPDLVRYLFTPLGLLCAVLNLTLLQAWVPIQVVYFSYNAVSWSISDELFFYVMFIWLLKDIQSARWRRLLVGMALPAIGIAVAIALRLPLYTTDGFAVDTGALTYTWPSGRIFEFVVGMVAASTFFHIQHRVSIGPIAASAIEILATVVVLAAMMVPTPWFEYGSIAHVLPKQLCLWLERSYCAPVFAAFILVIGFERGVVSRMLQSPVLILLGEISYSTYLLHQIVLRYWHLHPDLFGILPDALSYLLFWIVTIVGSFLLWRWVERPMRAWLTRVLYHRRRVSVQAVGV